MLLKTTTGILSKPNVLKESRTVTMFLAIWNVTEILCSFRLVLAGKVSKELSESGKLLLSENISAENAALQVALDNTLKLLNRGGIADQPSLRKTIIMCQPSHKPTFMEVIDSYLTSISKFGRL